MRVTTTRCGARDARKLQDFRHASSRDRLRRSWRRARPQHKPNGRNGSRNRRWRRRGNNTNRRRHLRPLPSAVLAYSKAMRIRRLSPRDPIPNAPAQSEIDNMWANAASAPYAAQPRFVPMNEQQSVISSSPDDSDEKWQAMKRRMPEAASVEQPAASSSSSIEMVPTGPIISTRLQMPGSSSSTRRRARDHECESSRRPRRQQQPTRRDLCRSRTAAARRDCLQRALL